jgi:hypothetical protein
LVKPRIIIRGFIVDTEVVTFEKARAANAAQPFRKGHHGDRRYSGSSRAREIISAMSDAQLSYKYWKFFREKFPIANGTCTQLIYFDMRVRRQRGFTAIRLALAGELIS